MERGEHGKWNVDYGIWDPYVDSGENMEHGSWIRSGKMECRTWSMALVFVRPATSTLDGIHTGTQKNVEYGTSKEDCGTWGAWNMERGTWITGYMASGKNMERRIMDSGEKYMARGVYLLEQDYMQSGTWMIEYGARIVE